MSIETHKKYVCDWCGKELDEAEVYLQGDNVIPWLEFKGLHESRKPAHFCTAGCLVNWLYNIKNF